MAHLSLAPLDPFLNRGEESKEVKGKKEGFLWTGSGPDSYQANNSGQSLEGD